MLSPSPRTRVVACLVAFAAIVAVMTEMSTRIVVRSTLQKCLLAQGCDSASDIHAVPMNRRQSPGRDEMRTCSPTAWAIRTAPNLKKFDDSLQRNIWDGSPIVFPELRLIYCSIPKNSCSVLKRLLLRLRSAPTWNATKGTGVHDPRLNLLTYMRNLTVGQANRILHSADWNRLVIVRDPIARFASAFLDKCHRDVILDTNITTAPTTSLVNPNCPVSDYKLSKSADAVLAALEESAWSKGYASINPHFRPQSHFCDLVKVAQSYHAIDRENIYGHMQDTIATTMNRSAHAIAMRALDDVYAFMGILDRKNTSSAELARTWAVEMDECRMNSSNATPACNHLIVKRLRVFYADDFQLLKTLGGRCDH